MTGTQSAVVGGPIPSAPAASPAPSAGPGRFARGEHSVEILREVGYTDAQIEALLGAAVVAAK